MGIVQKQAINNTVITYLGFGFGALNTLFLYTQLLEPEYYGLVTFILASGALLMPLMAFGVLNTLVKFYSGQKEEEKNGFLTLMLLLPMAVCLVLAAITGIFQEQIGTLISQKNEQVRDYVWYVFVIGVAMAYFEVFFAWSKVHLKSVFGNFMKEVFARVGATVLLLAFYAEWITLDTFFIMLVVLYVLRMIIMKAYAYRLRMPKLDFNFPAQTREILVYSTLIILGGSAAVVLLEIDKVMINQFKTLDNLAYYGVAIYIATVVIVPSRAMHQITYPLTAELLNKGNLFELDTLYKKTSLTLFIASGLLFLLITLNLGDLYQLLPEAYAEGFYIVFLIGLAKVFDSLLGNINSILYNSRYYKTILLLGVCLALATFLLNLWLIPLLGIEGAALASFIAIFLFNLIKLIFVKLKFGLLPFTKKTGIVLILLLFLGVAFTNVKLSFHPVVNIGIKSLVFSVVYLTILYRLKVSEDVSRVISKFLEKLH